MFDSYLSYLAHFYERHTPSELLRLGVTNIMHHLALGNQIQNVFIVPTAQDNFGVVAVNRKSTPMVIWTTDFTNMTLSIWEDISRGAYDGLKYAETELFDNINAGDLIYPWDSLHTSQASPSTYWYLSIRDESGSGEVFNSTYFLFEDDSEEPYTEQELRKREDSKNTFINPPPTDLNDPITKDYTLNPNYAEGLALTITWSTNLSSYGLAFWQDLSCIPKCSNGPTYLQESFTADSAQSFGWTVTPSPYSLADSQVFWFGLYENVNGQFVEPTPPIHAHYFNITTAASTSSSSSSTSTSSTSSIVSSNIQTSSTASSSSPSSTITSSASTSQSSSSLQSTSGETATTTSTSPHSTSSALSDSLINTSTSSAKSSFLSNGAKIGIALSSIAFVSLVTLIGYIACHYGQKRANTKAEARTLPRTGTSNTANSISGGFFGSGGNREENSMDYSRSVGDLSGYSPGISRQAPVSEMDGVGRYASVPRGIVYELPGKI